MSRTHIYLLELNHHSGVGVLVVVVVVVVVVSFVICLLLFIFFLKWPTDLFMFGEYDCPFLLVANFCHNIQNPEKKNPKTGGVWHIPTDHVWWTGRQNWMGTGGFWW